MSTRRNDSERIWELMGRLFKTHPWHGVTIGPEAPRVVTAYVEIVPTDTVKYEIDKLTGHLKVDRPQKFSNVCPTLYGFLPQTFSDRRVAELASRRTGRAGLEGDGDPLDVCVFSEKSFSHGDFLLKALLERLEHYFLTYKLAPGPAVDQRDQPQETIIAGVYGRAEAREVIERSRQDYAACFPDLKDQVIAALRGDSSGLP